MKIFLFAIMCCGLLTLSCCTYSINMIHSQGQSTDAVDETQSATPDIRPTLSIPAAAFAG